jgi:restriction endonuclease S subunit
MREQLRAEQTAIAEVLTEMDGELAGLEQRREKTRALKQAMMQELLTDRTRLVESGRLLKRKSGAKVPSTSHRAEVWPLSGSSTERA